MPDQIYWRHSYISTLGTQHSTVHITSHHVCHQQACLGDVSHSVYRTFLFFSPIEYWKIWGFARRLPIAYCFGCCGQHVSPSVMLWLLKRTISKTSYLPMQQSGDLGFGIWDLGFNIDFSIGSWSLPILESSSSEEYVYIQCSLRITRAYRKNE